MESVTIKRALLSVFDKTQLLELARVLADLQVTILSTGGTATALRAAEIPVTDVSDITNWPEMLGGRVKTLHPAVHGGLLAKRDDPAHMDQLAANNIQPIDLVVCNLYPFELTAASGKSHEECIEMIDIGGQTMIRAAAKNSAAVTVITSPAQYQSLIDELRASEGAVSAQTRKALARDAFLTTSKYDAAVSSFLSQSSGPLVQARHYEQAHPLKYGVNPHQKPAAVHVISGNSLPYTVLNGAPGYTNLMDALNSWQLVREVQAALGSVAAASFKHVSPAGAAIAEPLTAELAQAYEVVGKELSPAALAYIRARNSDPLCSYGDFAAISGVVDVCTAEILSREVSDGVIALGYEDAALEILKKKKGGKYVVLQGNPAYQPPADEYKEVYGVALSQKRNDLLLGTEHFKNIVTRSKDLPEAALRDLILASITVKYTQSNSVCYAINGQVVGVGAGQQSRVDCVKLAGRKVATWHMRLHPKVRALAFKPEVKRPDRVNARVAYINNDMTANERQHWEALFTAVPSALTTEERDQWMGELRAVSVSSDAFFPFRDNIDQCAKFGVTYVVQPGGSVQVCSLTIFLCFRLLLLLPGFLFFRFLFASLANFSFVPDRRTRM
eukprot:m.743975 g.743975  ORF g.743975 m.743975 type:complete len:615 (-) comp58949_c0_seq1:7-1851(-)